MKQFFQDTSAAEAARVHAGLTERFIRLVEEELARTTDGFVRESLLESIEEMHGIRRVYCAAAGQRRLRLVG